VLLRRAGDLKQSLEDRWRALAVVVGAELHGEQRGGLQGNVAALASDWQSIARPEQLPRLGNLFGTPRGRPGPGLQPFSNGLPLGFFCVFLTLV
jgi:hypothetical protein